MQNPNQKPRMTPFQEAMLKFEQALKESMEVEQARAREQSARMAQQRPTQSARPAGQRPRQPQPMAPRIVNPAYTAASTEGDPGYDLRYPNIGGQVTMPTIAASTHEPAGQPVRQTAAYAETSRAIDSFQGHQAAATAADAAYQTIVPLTQTASPLMQGVIWSEVLGKPVSRRRGRGRHGF